jgi:hypothetical protein
MSRKFIHIASVQRPNLKFMSRIPAKRDGYCRSVDRHVKFLAKINWKYRAAIPSNSAVFLVLEGLALSVGAIPRRDARLIALDINKQGSRSHLEFVITSPRSINWLSLVKLSVLKCAVRPNQAKCLNTCSACDVN